MSQKPSDIPSRRAVRRVKRRGFVSEIKQKSSASSSGGHGKMRALWRSFVYHLDASSTVTIVRGCQSNVFVGQGDLSRSDENLKRWLSGRFMDVSCSVGFVYGGFERLSFINFRRSTVA